MTQTMPQKLISLCLAGFFMIPQASCAMPAADKTDSLHTVFITPEMKLSSINQALQRLADRPDKKTRWTVTFAPGNYGLEKAMAVDHLENVDLVSNPKAPAVISKATPFNGEMLVAIRFAKSVRVSGFTFRGRTDFADGPTPVWPDQGVYFGSSNGVTIENNRFENFGNAAVRITTSEQDPVKGINSFNTKVSHNVFDNIYQISTTSNDHVHGASSGYVFSDNRITRLRGSVKFATRTPGARDVKLINNVIDGGDHYGFEVNNYDDFEISGNLIRNIKEMAINVYTNNRAASSFNWGNNFVIRNNRIENVARGIRFSPNPYPDKTPVTPKHVVIEDNILTSVKDTHMPAIAVMNGSVEDLIIARNKLSKLGNNKPIVYGGHNPIRLLNNTVEPDK